MNYTAMRNGYKKGAGVDYNDVVYHSKVQTWELEIPTGNNTTPYIIAYWTVKDGPVVVEIPGGTKDVSLFGGMMYLSSAYHSPLEVTGNVLLSLSVYKTLSNPNISRSPVTPRKVW